VFWFPAEAEPARPTECLLRLRVNGRGQCLFFCLFLTVFSVLPVLPV
jgi:hypothetical protein